MSQIFPWLRLHASAILATAIASANAHLIPSWVGALAQAIAVACGASN
jgi:hypothetical protein